MTVLKTKFCYKNEVLTTKNAADTLVFKSTGSLIRCFKWSIVLITDSVNQKSCHAPKEGFQKEVRTEAVLQLVETMSSNLDQNKANVAIVLDLEPTLKSISHTIFPKK